MRKLIRTYDLQSFTGRGKCTPAQAENFMRQIATFCNKTSWCKTDMICSTFHLCYFGGGTEADGRTTGAYVNSRTGMGTVNAVYTPNILSGTFAGRRYDTSYSTIPLCIFASGSASDTK